MNSLIKKSILFCTLAFLFYRESEAQYITLPDPAFATFIAANYPAAVNGSNQLDTNAAKTITGTFNCKYKGINNASGLQYFQGLSKIYLTGNNLSTVPNLDKTVNLTDLILDTNKISSLPALSNLSNLETFTCRVNQLTSIPSMAGLTNLTTFLCDNNKLTAMPDLTGCTALDFLIVSDNKISSLPDMSTLTSLRRFLITNNLLSVADLSSIPNLKEVHLIYNRLTAFPTFTGTTQFTEIRVSKNNIDSLPDLSSFSNLSIFEVQNNKLSFEDLIPLTTHPHFSSFVISPQQQLLQKDSMQFEQGDSLVWKTMVDNSIASNTYSWYKNNVLINSGSSNIFRIDSLTLADNGLYTFEVRNSNPALSAVVLYSHTMKIVVRSCFDASQLTVDISDNACKFPVAGTVNESTIYGGVAPYTYTIINSVTGKQTVFSSASLSIPQDGLFDLQIRDALGCTVNLSKKISLSRNQKCDPVIYPDSQGPESSYYIDNSGKAVVYNLEGIAIRQLNLPGYWDGTNQQGALVDTGLYMIVINDQIRIQVSIIRKN
ncbi:MAG: leucine-rich repeat domain-containing protein [Cytophagaceae bacterium]